jgi:CIC family chloride channel protein
VPADVLRRVFNERGLHGAVVVDDAGGLVGVVARSDLERSGADAGALATRRPVTAVTDEPVFRAVQRMANMDIGRLPVIDRATGRVVGVFRRADVVRAYDRGIERSVGERMARDAGRLRDITGLQAVQLVVGDESCVRDRAVRDVRWPERTILTGVRRGTEAIVPAGDTVLEVDDLVVALTGDPEALRALLREGVPTTSTASAAEPGAPATSPSAPDPSDPGGLAPTQETP